MQRPPRLFLPSFYKRTWEQYQKLLARLQKSLNSGRFYQLSSVRQHQLLNQLKKYLKRLKKNLTGSTTCPELDSGAFRLSFSAAFRPSLIEYQQLSRPKDLVTQQPKGCATRKAQIPITKKKLAIGITILTTLLAASTTDAQTYVQPPCSNPLGFVDVGENSYPVFGDLNGDGLQDAIIGANNGQISFFQNNGSATAPSFVAQTGNANPFNGIDVGTNATPFVVDIDGDNDLDLFIGQNSGMVDFYRNTGTLNTPNFVQQLGANNPLNGVDVGTVSAPNFVDIDGDNDLDVFIPANDASGGKIEFFQNNGGVFTQILGAANPFDTAPVGANPLITFVDQDEDGDLDAFVGSQLGMIQFYQNNGTVNAPNFQLQPEANNPLSGVDVGRNAALIPNPCFVDINGDGNKDIFIGSQDGVINYFENNPSIVCDDLNYQKITGNENPADTVEVGSSSSPAFVDIDNDGDQDLFVGDSLGMVAFFENEGTADSPNLVPKTGPANPFDGVDVEDIATISFADINGDGLADAFIGEDDGVINFFSNTGTANNPVFTQINGAGNPFDGVDVGTQSSPAFADIDNDGDLDAFIGNKAGQILFFRNDGTANTPNFVQFTDMTNPFFGVDLEGKFMPEFGDIDNDGDLDAIIGNKAGTLYYFRNDGTATAPKFVGLYGNCNPFNNLLPVLTTDDEFSSPALVDIDNDGTLEVFVGRQGGQLCLLKRNIPQVTARRQIPTLSEWGLLIFGLLILNLGVFFTRRFQQLKDHLY